MNFLFSDGSTGRLFFNYNFDIKKRKVTQCIIEHHNQNKSEENKVDFAWLGITICSKKDTFVKEIGRRIALSYAVNQISNKQDRKIIWKTYWTHTNQKARTEKMNSR